MSLVEEDVGLVVGDKEDLEQFVKLSIAPLGLLCLSQINLVKKRVHGFNAVMKQNDAKNQVTGKLLVDK